MTEWCCVDNELPDQEDEYLVCVKPEMLVASFTFDLSTVLKDPLYKNVAGFYVANGKEGYDFGFDIVNPDYWMLLPNPPEDY